MQYSCIYDIYALISYWYQSCAVVPVIFPSAIHPGARDPRNPRSPRTSLGPQGTQGTQGTQGLLGLASSSLAFSSGFGFTGFAPRRRSQRSQVERSARGCRWPGWTTAVDDSNAIVFTQIIAKEKIQQILWTRIARYCQFRWCFPDDLF